MEIRIIRDVSGPGRGHRGRDTVQVKMEGSSRNLKSRRTATAGRDKRLRVTKENVGKKRVRAWLRHDEQTATGRHMRRHCLPLPDLSCRPAAIHITCRERRVDLERTLTRPAPTGAGRSRSRLTYHPIQHARGTRKGRSARQRHQDDAPYQSDERALFA